MSNKKEKSKLGKILISIGIFVFCILLSGVIISLIPNPRKRAPEDITGVKKLETKPEGFILDKDTLIKKGVVMRVKTYKTSFIKATEPPNGFYCLQEKIRGSWVDVSDGKEKTYQGSTVIDMAYSVKTITEFRINPKCNHPNHRNMFLMVWDQNLKK